RGATPCCIRSRRVSMSSVEGMKALQRAKEGTKEGAGEGAKESSGQRPLEVARGRSDTGRQFLPAGPQNLETPGPPAGPPVAPLILFFAIATGWSVFGHVDIIATAQGKIVPTGRTKTIQPLETGIISAIRVRDGDRVTAGQVLIELDRTVTQAERKRVTQDLL